MRPRFAPNSLRQEYMALLTLPVAFVVGLVIRDRRRASRATLLLWLVAMAGLLVAKLGGAAVSPGKRSSSSSVWRRPFCWRGSPFV